LSKIIYGKNGFKAGKQAAIQAGKAGGATPVHAATHIP
jgi:hypothetical protein